MTNPIYRSLRDLHLPDSMYTTQRYGIVCAVAAQARSRMMSPLQRLLYWNIVRRIKNAR